MVRQVDSHLGKSLVGYWAVLGFDLDQSSSRSKAMVGMLISHVLVVAGFFVALAATGDFRSFENFAHAFVPAAYALGIIWAVFGITFTLEDLASRPR